MTLYPEYLDLTTVHFGATAAMSTCPEYEYPTAGYNRHRRAGTDVCSSCFAAAAAYWQDRPRSPYRPVSVDGHIRGRTPLAILDTVDVLESVTLAELSALIDAGEATIRRAVYRLLNSGELTADNGHLEKGTP